MIRTFNSLIIFQLTHDARTCKVRTASDLQHQAHTKQKFYVELAHTDPNKLYQHTLGQESLSTRLDRLSVIQERNTRTIFHDELFVSFLPESIKELVQIMVE